MWVIGDVVCTVTPYHSTKVERIFELQNFCLEYCFATRTSFHFGRMFDVITRCFLGVCDTARVEMKCATCPFAHGSA